MGIFDALLGTKTNAANNAASGQAEGYQQAVAGSNEQMLRGLNTDAQNAVTSYGNQGIGAINTGAMPGSV